MTIHARFKYSKFHELAIITKVILPTILTLGGILAFAYFAYLTIS